MPLLPATAAAFGATVICERGYEADDYIASYVAEAERRGFRSVIVSRYA